MKTAGNGARGEGGSRKFLMTTSWDDGHPLDFRIAELLTKYGLTGTFYVPRASQRQVMSAEQVRELSGTFEIGAHTLDHVLIDRVPDAEAGRQLLGSRRWVEEITGKSCKVFCFPAGKYRKRQLRLVCEAGFLAARTVELLSVSEPRPMGGLWIIPTTIQAFPHGLFTYAKNAAKRLSASRRVNWTPILHSKDWLALARKMFLRTVQRGGVFHLWGHSWEIEEEGQWENLESLLNTMSERRQELKSVTNGELCKYAASSGRFCGVPLLSR